MLYYAGTIVKPEIPIVEPTGKEAAHALVLLVEFGLRIAPRLRPLPDLPVDVPLPGGILRSEEHTSELQSRQYLHSFPTRRSSDLRSCSGTTGAIRSANCAPPAPAPGPSCGCPSAWRDSPLARICWASPAACAPWAWSRPATTGSWTSSIARPWIWTNSPAPGAL